MTKPDETDKEAPAAMCSCMQDPFAGVPPEMILRPAPKKNLLRHVTCPGCGMLYWTNRDTDLCIDCEYKVKRSPTATATPGT